MPNPVNNKHGVQWDRCDRCGNLFPMSKLIKQLGLLVCQRDWDDLENQRRPIEIERILNQGVDQEGVDLRAEDRGFFQGDGEELV